MVNWDSLEDGLVTITCPTCGAERRQRARQIAYRIRRGDFTGVCYRDRLLSRQPGDGPPHPAVDWHRLEALPIADGRQRLLHVEVTCPRCGEARWCRAAHTAQKIKQERFTGRCQACADEDYRATRIELAPGRRVCRRSGYIRLHPQAIPDEHRALFDALRGKRNWVLEHRFVMAMKLGRALHPGELVDHVDGDKTNNHPINLRIYHKGLGARMGDSSGFGLFYDEWQNAEARVRDLEEHVATCPNCSSR